MAGDRGKFCGGQPAEYFTRFIGREYLGTMGLDVVCKSSGEHIAGEISFQLAFANEKDDWMKTGLREIEKLFKRLRVSEILVKGVLERIFLAVNGLGPLGGSLAPKYPAVHVFGLNNKYSEN